MQHAPTISGCLLAQLQLRGQQTMEGFWKWKCSRYGGHPIKITCCRYIKRSWCCFHSWCEFLIFLPMFVCSFRCNATVQCSCFSSSINNSEISIDLCNPLLRNKPYQQLWAQSLASYIFTRRQFAQGNDYHSMNSLRHAPSFEAASKGPVDGIELIIDIANHIDAPPNNSLHGPAIKICWADTCNAQLIY